MSSANFEQLWGVSVVLVIFCIAINKLGFAWGISDCAHTFGCSVVGGRAKR